MGDRKIVKILKVLMLTPIIVISCGKATTEPDENSGLFSQLNEVDFSENNNLKVPFPLFACKNLYRSAAAKSELSAAMETLQNFPLLSKEDLTKEMHGYVTDQRKSAKSELIAAIESLNHTIASDPLSPVWVKALLVKKNQELREFESIHSENAYRRLYLSWQIQDQEYKFKTLFESLVKEPGGYAGEFPSAMLHHFDWKKSGLPYSWDDIRRYACSKAMDEFIQGFDHLPESYYQSIGKYFEPERLLSEVSNWLISDDYHLRLSYQLRHLFQDLVTESEPRFVIPKESFFAESVQISERAARSIWYASSYITENFPELEEEQSNIIDFSESYKKERMLTSLNGLPGLWKKKSEFETAWDEIFARAHHHFDACNLVFDGGWKNTDREVPPVGCVSATAEKLFETSVRQALLSSLIILDIAGHAYSEGDVEGAQELLNLAKETLKFAADLAIGLSPAGRAKDIIEAISGYSIIPPDFEQLSLIDRTVNVMGAATVGTPVLKILVKYAKKSRVLQKIIPVEPHKITQKMLQTADDMFDEIKVRLPKNNGAWVGQEGKSIWKSNDSRVLEITNGKGVPYRNFFPDFSDWVVDSKQFNNLTGQNSHDFKLVYKWLMEKHNLPNESSARKYLSDNKLTPHHVEDGVTIQLVPTDLHRVHHSGGASLLRKIREKVEVIHND